MGFGAFMALGIAGFVPIPEPCSDLFSRSLPTLFPAPTPAGCQGSTGASCPLRRRADGPSAPRTAKLRRARPRSCPAAGAEPLTVTALPGGEAGAWQPVPAPCRGWVGDAKTAPHEEFSHLGPLSARGTVPEGAKPTTAGGWVGGQRGARGCRGDAGRGGARGGGGVSASPARDRGCRVCVCVRVCASPAPTAAGAPSGSR